MQLWMEVCSAYKIPCFLCLVGISRDSKLRPAQLISAPGGVLPLPQLESGFMQQEEQPWALQLDASCLFPSTYSALCFLSLFLPNKQNNSCPCLTEPWHYWGHCRTQCLPSTTSDLQKVSISPLTSASLSTTTCAEWHLEPVIPLFPPGSTNEAKCALTLNND